MKPGTSPGFPAIAYAMYPASTGRSSLKDAPPMSFTSFQVGAAEKSGPEPDVMGTNAMLSAIKIPPQAMNGIANETPVSSACRTFWSASIMGRLGADTLSPPARPWKTAPDRTGPSTSLIVDSSRARAYLGLRKDPHLTHEMERTDP